MATRAEAQRPRRRGEHGPRRSTLALERGIAQELHEDPADPEWLHAVEDARRTPVEERAGRDAWRARWALRAFWSYCELRTYGPPKAAVTALHCNDFPVPAEVAAMPGLTRQHGDPEWVARLAYQHRCERKTYDQIAAGEATATATMRAASAANLERARSQKVEGTNPSQEELAFEALRESREAFIRVSLDTPCRVPSGEAIRKLIAGHRRIWEIADEMLGPCPPG